MRAIIFAAGMGTRISRHIGDQPKCLVPINGIPLIRHTVNLLRRKGVDEIAVVTGFKAEAIESVLPDSVQVIRNPFFAVSNSIASLWFARDFIGGAEALLAMNGDVFIEEVILDRLLAAKPKDSPTVMVADSTRIEDADYKFAWEDGLLRKFGKQLQPEETTGEYVGIGLIRGSGVDDLLSAVQTEVMAGNYNKWWEEAIYMKAAAGQKVRILDIAGHFWVELDFVEDLNRLHIYMEQTRRIPAE